MMNILAASFDVPIEGGGTPLSWGYPDLGKLMGNLLQAAIIVAGIGALAFLLMAGLQYITSGGEKAQMEAARGKITNAVTGLALVVSSYALARIIETIFGISIVSGITWPHP